MPNKKNTKDTTTQQDASEIARAIQRGEKGVVLNPTGKGGFKDNPQNQSPGGWRKEDSIPYQYNRLMRMTQAEFNEFIKRDDLTMAEKIAAARIKDASHSGKNLSLYTTSEIVDRTEGRARQSVKMDVDGAPPVAQLVIMKPPVVDGDKGKKDAANR